jgi:hypothetical protein
MFEFGASHNDPLRQKAVGDGLRQLDDPLTSDLPVNRSETQF